MKTFVLIPAGLESLDYCVVMMGQCTSWAESVLTGRRPAVIRRRLLHDLVYI